MTLLAPFLGLIYSIMYEVHQLELLAHGLKFSKVARRMSAGNVFCLCLFYTQTLPPRWTRCHQHYIARLVLGRTRKIHSDISPIPSLNFTRSQQVRIWPRFSTVVALMRCRFKMEQHCLNLMLIFPLWANVVVGYFVPAYLVQRPCAVSISETG